MTITDLLPRLPGQSTIPDLAQRRGSHRARGACAGLGELGQELTSPRAGGNRSLSGPLFTELCHSQRETSYYSYSHNALPEGGDRETRQGADLRSEARPGGMVDGINSTYRGEQREREGMLRKCVHPCVCGFHVDVWTCVSPSRQTEKCRQPTFIFWPHCLEHRILVP